MSTISTVPFYRIKSVNSGLYVVANNPSSDDSHLSQQPIGAKEPQEGYLWGFIAETGGKYRIFNACRGFSVDAEGNSPHPGNHTRLKQHNWKPEQGNQLWYWDDERRVFISSYSADMVWDVKGKSIKPGAEIQLHEYNGGNHQQWALEPASVTLSTDAVTALAAEGTPAG